MATVQAYTNQALWTFVDGALAISTSTDGGGGVITPTTVNGPDKDAFFRQRVSEISTKADFKQIVDNLPLFFDDQGAGSGTGSVYNNFTASSILSVDNASVSSRIRQTFRRFNYQPGKSQLWKFTGIAAPSQTGIDSGFGAIDDDNGLAYGVDEIGPYFLVRSSVTGSVVDTKIYQTAWNVDRLDGSPDNNPSGVTLSPTTQNLFTVDAEWLGVGAVRFGFYFNGRPIYCHIFNAQTTLTTPYTSTLNLPLRYWIENDGTGAAAEMTQTCTSVGSEGGEQETGLLRSIGRNDDPPLEGLDVPGDGEWYGLIGLRLKPNALGISVDPIGITVLNTSGGTDVYEVAFLWNPTFTGGEPGTWEDLTDSAVQYNLPTTATNEANSDVVFNRRLAYTDFFARSAAEAVETNALQLGAAIDGTQDRLWLCVRSLNGGALTMFASQEWTEKL